MDDNKMDEWNEKPEAENKEPENNLVYDFSEIEKIQWEIEQDLAGLGQKNETKPDKTISIEIPDIAIEGADAAEGAEVIAAVDAAESAATREAAEVEIEIPEEKLLAAAVSSAESALPFYQETIKSKRRLSLRAVTAVCLVSILGGSFLGMGIGVAIPLTQYYWLGGINAQKDGDNVKEAMAYGIDSTSYVFGGLSDQTQSDGITLSDVVRLVEPSVVGVAALFSDSASGQSSPGDASGIIFAQDSEKIYIVTNNHVVNGASSVNVSIADSGPLAARLVGKEAASDLAVLSVDKKVMQKAGVQSIVIAVLGDSDAMQVGDVVLAIGNAMGEGNSATMGIISATEKKIPIQNRILSVLQTDAAINPGNSGGPLINARGEVVGINTAKLLDYTYPVEGMGYSISSNVAKPILEEIMSNTSRPFLGVSGTTITEELAEQFNIPPIGVWVEGVFKDSGADKAGIVRTDIITSFNGNTLFTMDQLAEEVKKCKIGDTVEVKLLRNGVELKILQVKLGGYTDDVF